MSEARDMPSPAGIDVKLLGGFAVRGREGAAVRVRSRKGCALIAYLAMHADRRARRERLADLLWGDRFDDRGRQNLRQCLANLRSDLANFGADVFALDPETIGLRPDRVTIDAHDFALLAGSRDELHQEQAISLYGGQFLADFSLDVEGFDEWVRAERARLAAMAARLFETHAERVDQRGLGEAAMSAVGRLVGIDPLREDWQRMALRLYARHRGREAALAYARAFAARLKNDLGVGPDAATIKLIEEIKRGRIVPASPIATQVAPPDNDRALTNGGLTLIAAGKTASAEATSGDEAVPPDDATAAGVIISALSGRASARRRRWSRWSVAGLAGIATAILLGVLALAPTADHITPQFARDLFMVNRRPPADPASGAPVVRPAVALDSVALATKGLYSIVVLPFTASADGGRAEQPLADQITDDLINDLSRAGELLVISRQTSELYKDRPIDVAAIGGELGVRYAVVGSVRSEGALLQINVELVDASTRVQAWTGRIERDQSESRTAADEIAWGITRQLHVEVVMAEDRRGESDNLSDPVIGELLAKGWAVIFRHNVTATTSAAENYFAQVLQRDPENLSATIGLAAHYVISVSNLYVSDREPYLSRADALLAKAIDKDPHSSSAYYFLGILQKTRQQSEAALRSFTIALELSPSNAPASAQIGSTLALLGRADEAMGYIRRAIRLSPKDPALGRWDMFGGQIELELGNDDEATEWLLRAVALNPRNVRARALLAAAYAFVGNKTDARRQVSEIKKIAPWVFDQPDRIFIDGSTSQVAGHAPRYVDGWHLAVAAAASLAPHQQ